MSDDITIKDGNMYGPWRKAINDFTPKSRPALRALFKNQNNLLNPHIDKSMLLDTTIHDDEMGKKVGMRGGVVAGIQHLDLFAPLLVKAFGQKCFETGSLSIFYTYALLEGEEVRAAIKIPPEGAKDAQVEAWAESKDGHSVVKGTVSMGNPREKTYIQAMEIESSPQEELRILKGLKVGYEMTPRDDEMDSTAAQKWVSFLEDSIGWYSKKSPWGPPIVSLSRILDFMQVAVPFQTKGTGFFGGTEINFIDGPVKTDVAYRATGKIIAVGATSKTEYYWFDSKLYEKASNKLVASLRHMNRFMKAGSPLYPEVK
ncbi:MAG: hypothetical protein PHY28_01790 [Dehalococcoidales bacterium]|nr:hypothetical protein [Dehalococcoidales bacterium]